MTIDLKELAKETVSAVANCHVCVDGILEFRVDDAYGAILDALKKLDSQFVNELLEGEARWSEAEKNVLKIMGGGMEYHVIHVEVCEADRELNDLAKDRWEVIHANGSHHNVYITLSRKRMKK